MLAPSLLVELELQLELTPTALVSIGFAICVKTWGLTSGHLALRHLECDWTVLRLVRGETSGLLTLLLLESD